MAQQGERGARGGESGADGGAAAAGEHEQGGHHGRTGPRYHAGILWGLPAAVKGSGSGRPTVCQRDSGVPLELRWAGLQQRRLLEAVCGADYGRTGDREFRDSAAGGGSGRRLLSALP